MLWLKRNLFFALSLAVAVGLFGYGCFYGFTQWSSNAEVDKQIEQADQELKKIYDSPGIFPSPTNIAVLQQQEADLRKFLEESSKRRVGLTFDAKISPSNFKTLMDNTLADLLRDAERERIGIVQRDFSFSAVKPLVSFAEGSVPLLAEQLAEIKLICGVLFRSEISSLENLRREAVSKDDVTGAATVDYHNVIRRTNELTGDVSSFYIVTVQGFSESLSSILNNVQRVPEGLSVRLISTSPWSQGARGPGAPPPPPGPPPGAPPAFQRGPAPAGRPGAAAAPNSAPRRLETLADEKAFRFSLLLEVSKPLPPAQ